MEDKLRLLILRAVLRALSDGGHPRTNDKRMPKLEGLTHIVKRIGRVE